MDYRDAKIFMKSIEKNDVFAIKSDLEGLIVLFKGDKIKCDEAVEYAINNSSFNWEDDDKIFFGEGLVTAKERYSYEKERLVQNFTKERYLKVLELYKEYNQEENKNNILNKTEVKEQQNNSSTFSYEKTENLKKSVINESKIKTGSSSNSNINQNRVNRKNVGLDQEDKIVFQRTAMLGLAIVVVVWILVKIIV
ncbi:hypothetical protein [Cetobacterium sp.]|uniref:hypothetical protein n=1 Tax=Cetobacterium sp. TaxID=2071632 RepID=UPI003EE74EBB